MAIQRAEAQTPTPAKLASPHTAAHKLPTNPCTSARVRRLGADNLFSTVIQLLQHRHVSANRCVGQTLTVQLNPRDPVATPIVARMDELFAVDAEARRSVIGLTRRHALRQERARPLLDDIRSKIEAAQPFALPSSALSKACQYALTLWRKLTRFLEYPELELSNNLAENSMRPVALGRKNWIHIGSPQAGPKIAAILSVVESCRRLKLPVRDYLAAVLPGFADLPIQRLPDLTPAAWVAQHS